MERLICIHGHFYQPPRENPWLEAVEVQDSAAPYHDWNERITAECYGPNARARVLDGEGRIIELINNYARMSFNFGPTLLSWMEVAAPHVYGDILDADGLSAERFSGHGSAMAQAYNHLILPLANARDRRTQVRWGARDFERRFGRRPEGLWLPETAVNVEALETLAEEGIAFTILAPHQARRYRRIGEKHWHDAGGGRIDPSRAYLCRLPSGRQIALFFYDGPISNALAFERLLERGERFAQRLMDAFDERRDHAQLVHVATDGETYGHHHRHGDMALAYALRHIDLDPSVRLTNYGEYLEQHPPAYEVEIVENTAWSCAHGVGRWKADCGCNSGGHGGWHQAWRGPLREALDWLRDRVAPLYERRAEELFADPWKARDAYIDVVCDRSPESVERFFREQGRGRLDDARRIDALRLLEMQRHAMLMYTSCGWFFDELSGIETVQVVHYAGRVVQLAEDVFKEPIEDGFTERLARAHSNLPEHADGRAIYRKWVKPAVLDLERVGTHHALSSLFEPGDGPQRIYAYEVEDLAQERREVGAVRFALGSARVRSVITHEWTDLTYAAIHVGGHDVTGGVRPARELSLAPLRGELLPLFERAELSALIRALDHTFGGEVMTLRALFRDAQRRVLDHIVAAERVHVEAMYESIYDRTAPLLRFFAGLRQPAPQGFRRAAEIVLRSRVRRALEAEAPDPVEVRTLLEEARGADVELDDRDLAYALERGLARHAAALRESPLEMEVLEHFASAVRLAAALPFEVDLWEVQNVWYDLCRTTHDEQAARSGKHSEAAAWVHLFASLAEPLRMALPR